MSDPISTGQVSLPNDGQILTANDPGTGITNQPGSQSAANTPAPPPSNGPQAKAPMPVPGAPNGAPAPVQQSQQSLPKPPAQQPANTVSNAPQPDLSQHPAVKRASLISTVARTLAGNPTQVRVNDDGTTTRTPVPLTGRQVALAIALEALGGAATGAAATPGPGQTGRAAGAAFAAGAGQVEQRNQNAETLSNQEYARRSQTLKTAMAMHNNALLVGKQDYETNSNYVNSYKDLATRMETDYPSYIKGYATYADLAKYNVTQDSAIPYQVVPRMGQDGKQVSDADGKPLWDVNYMIVDPSLKATSLLTPEDISTAKEFHIPGFDNKLLSESPMNLSMALDYKARLSTLEGVDSEFSQFFNTLNDNAPKGQKPLEPVNLAAAAKTDAGLVPALEKFNAAYVRTFPQNPNGSFSQALATVAQSDPGAATKIAAALGGIDNVHRYDGIVTPVQFKTYQDALNAQSQYPKGSPQYQKAQTYLDNNKDYQASLAGAKQKAISAAKGAAGGTGLGDPSLAKYVTPTNVGPDGINHAYLQALRQKNPQRAAIVEAVGTGRNLMSTYGLSRKDAQSLMGDVDTVYTDFDQGKVGEYEAAVKNFGPGGKTGQNLVNLNTALTHLSHAYDDAGWLSTTPGLSGVGKLVGVKAAGEFKTNKQTLAEELATAYKGGTPSEQEIKEWLDVLTAVNPSTLKTSMATAANRLVDRISLIQDRWNDSVPSTFVRPMQFVSDPAAKAYQHMTGNTIPSGLRIPPGATMKVPGSDGKLHWSDGMKDLGVVE